jgi:hypothetical protein
MFAPVLTGEIRFYVCTPWCFAFHYTVLNVNMAIQVDCYYKAAHYVQPGSTSDGRLSWSQVFEPKYSRGFEDLTTSVIRSSNFRNLT